MHIDLQQTWQIEDTRALADVRRNQRLKCVNHGGDFLAAVASGFRQRIQNVGLGQRLLGFLCHLIKSPSPEKMCEMDLRAVGKAPKFEIPVFLQAEVEF